MSDEEHNGAGEAQPFLRGSTAAPGGSDALYSTSHRRRDAGEAVEATKKDDRMVCSRVMDTLRGYFAFHLIKFIAHYASFVISILATVSHATSKRGHGTVLNGLGLLGIVSIIVDIYLLKKHYKEETYFPYCAAPHLLFMTHRKRVDPTTPPNDTLYITEKILIFWQGYICAILPYMNLAKSLDAAKQKDSLSEWETIVLTLIIVQLAISIVSWALFVLFYLFFTFELLTRFFCFFCCMYRPRTNQQPVPSDDHILASHSSDPIYYQPYAFLYEYM